MHDRNSHYRGFVIGLDSGTSLRDVHDERVNVISRFQIYGQIGRTAGLHLIPLSLFILFILLQFSFFFFSPYHTVMISLPR